jgi:GDP-4-dehydro-6-deoxy-D-mannose reductase
MPDAAHPISLGGVRLHRVDIRDRVALRRVLGEEKPDIVFHLAAISHVPTARTIPEVAFDVNVVGTFNLLENLRQLEDRPRIVFVSSGNLYGETDSAERGFDEMCPVDPRSPYATSKLIGERIVRSYVEDFGLEIVIARPFNHTGPGQPPSFACPEFARLIAAGMAQGLAEVKLKTGRLEPRRDISDVRDIVRAYALLAEQGTPGAIYNVCSGSMVSMKQVIEMLGDLGQVQVTTELDLPKVRPHEIMRSGGNCSKIHDELGWVAEIPLRETLRNLLDYWFNRMRKPSEPH